MLNIIGWSKGMLKVELGGGPNPVYHPNIDILEHPAVDCVQDVTKGIPLPDGSAELIFSRDFIEHITFYQFLCLLEECWRVLVEGGRIEFITPDIQRTEETWNEWNEHVTHMYIGEWNRGEAMRHKMWFSVDLMRYILENGEWNDIEVTDYIGDADHWKEPKMRVVAVK